MVHAETSTVGQVMRNSIEISCTYLSNEGNAGLNGGDLDRVRHLRLERLQYNRDALALRQEPEERHKRVRDQRDVDLVWTLPERPRVVAPLAEHDLDTASGRRTLGNRTVVVP